jgi:hypothetical protein
MDVYPLNGDTPEGRPRDAPHGMPRMGCPAWDAPHGGESGLSGALLLPLERAAWMLHRTMHHGRVVTVNLMQTNDD